MKKEPVKKIRISFGEEAVELTESITECFYANDLFKSNCYENTFMLKELISRIENKIDELFLETLIEKVKGLNEITILYKNESRKINPRINQHSQIFFLNELIKLINNCIEAKGTLIVERW